MRANEERDYANVVAAISRRREKVLPAGSCPQSLISFVSALVVAKVLMAAHEQSQSWRAAVPPLLAGGLSGPLSGRVVLLPSPSLISAAVHRAERGRLHAPRRHGARALAS